jgi:hypothetical protein
MSALEQATAQAESKSSAPGPRGDVGEGTPSRNLKRAHRRNRRDGISLKAFARREAKHADLASAWFANKRG